MKFPNRKLVLIAIITIAVFGLMIISTALATDPPSTAPAGTTPTSPVPQNPPAGQSEPSTVNRVLQAIGNTTDSSGAGTSGGTQGWEAQTYTGNIFLFIAGMLLSMFATILQFLISYSNEVISLPFIQAGFQAVLGFANLGFVLAIIIIAFATIFRVQGYAMKQVLWKLIVAALLINFSLVIAGAFISVSNTLSNFFLQGLKGQSISTLSDHLAAVLSPQYGLRMKEDGGAFTKLLKNIATPSAFIIEYLSSLFFSLVFVVLVVLVFLAITIMFLIRLIYLSFLIVMMPLVWLAWIFPGTQSHWHKWWHNFLRWTFFAPIMLFFIVTIINTGDILEQKKGSSLSSNTSNNSTALDQSIATAEKSEQAKAFYKNVTLAENTDNGMSSSTGPSKNAEGFIGYFIKVILFGGLFVGSLIAANSLGIAGASQALAYTKGAGKMVGGWAGRKSFEKTGSKILGSERVKKWTNTLAASKIPGVRFVGAGINRLGAKSEEIVKGNYAKRIKGMSPERKNIEYEAARGVEKAVYADEMAKSKDISPENMEEIINDPKMATKMSENFKSAGLKFKNVEVAIGHSLGMITAKTVKEYEDAADKHFMSLSNKDWQDGQWNDIFNKTEDTKIIDRQRKLLRRIAEKTPGAHSKILPQVKPENIEHFSELSRDEIKLLRQLNKNAGEKASGIFEQALDRRLKFFADDLWAPPGKEKKESTEEEPEKPREKAGFV